LRRTWPARWNKGPGFRLLYLQDQEKEASMNAARLSGSLILAAALLSAPSVAQNGSGERIRRIVIYGNDPCPRASAGDIIVCARRREQERYRIPQEFRDDGNDPESQSWAARASALEYVGRSGIQSCSTVGPGGFTGCWAEIMRAARSDRRVSEDEPGR
jgi:hypothetical protein